MDHFLENRKTDSESMTVLNVLLDCESGFLQGKRMEFCESCSERTALRTAVCQARAEKRILKNAPQYSVGDDARENQTDGAEVPSKVQRVGNGPDTWSRPWM